ncbi:MAG: PH domain-containing protein, partial [Pseudomonadales bacterium]|nr:PH domain-containing protein [Pseudomonadales bacterium]
EDRIPLYRVIDKSLSFPFSERIFDCGTVTVHAKDKTCPMTLLKSIKDPRKVMKLLDEHVQRERDKYGVHGHDMVAAYGS